MDKTGPSPVSAARRESIRMFRRSLEGMMPDYPAGLAKISAHTPIQRPAARCRYRVYCPEM